MTESEKLVMGVETEALLKNTTARESWRIFGIMSEFVEATERLAAIKPAVTLFGSARVPPDSKYYTLTEQLARLIEMLAAHEAAQQAQPGNWGFVGDLRHVSEVLDQLDGFLGNE